FTYNQSSDVNTTSGSILSLPKLHTRNYDVPETEYNHIEIENFNLNTEPSIVSYSKVTEYIGRIAPKDKIALYMGCAYLPVTFGNLLAGF
ncbi:MAG TPA: hypothetical protein DEQ03_17675, partial [Marinilabiliales bacterium]|nr:hypothetical protein [Marinilabiliales bacterium]